MRNKLIFLTLLLQIGIQADVALPLTAHQQPHTRQGVQKIIMGVICAAMLAYGPAYWGFERCKKEWKRSSMKIGDKGKARSDYDQRRMIGGLIEVFTPVIPLYLIYEGCCDANIIPQDKEKTRQLHKTSSEVSH